MARSLALAWMCGVALVVQGCASRPKKAEPPRIEETDTENCRSAREYITTLEYLRGQKAFALPDREAERVAETVAAACNGAAKRFVSVVELLSRSDLATRVAIETGLKVAPQSGAQAQAFIQIFKRTFLARYLDLDAKTSVQIALSLSAEFEGNPATAANDYSDTVDFCVHRKGLDLPRPFCAELSARIARLGNRYTSGGAARAFQDAYEFLTSSSRAPDRPTVEAVKMAEEIAAQGPSGVSNFREAYRYAISNGGLKAADSDALVFAKKMTALSTLKRKSN